MHWGVLTALEFDRIVTVVTGLAVTPTGRSRLAETRPSTDASEVVATQRATSEGVRFLADHLGFPLRAPSDLEELLDALAIEGRPLEPLRLLGLAGYLESIEHSRSAIRNSPGLFPLLERRVSLIATFGAEIADIRRKIEPSGEVADHASPALASIRERLRKHKARLRTTLESFVRGRDTAKYLQEQIVTDRNGRHVLIVRAEHRSAIPGIVHGGSASGASLFVEPLETVEINNEIVELEEQEAEEVRRILLLLTDAFRAREDDVARTIEVATDLDVIQARARFSIMVDGIEPAISTDGTFDLRGARHPLLILAVRARLESDESRPPEPRAPSPESRTPSPESRAPSPESRAPSPESRPAGPVPVEITLTPPARVLVITGPNTGGKTVALKTAGLLSLMAQAGLHVPADKGSRLPVFRAIFADIGDEQSISASLSTFSGHIANIVSMDRDLTLPALVLLDEVGAGTDPAEGGALGMAVIDHFRARGAHLLATTHYDQLKSYASTTDGVISAAFGFNPETFAPTYRLVYGSPGRSLAIEIAARLGVPRTVIAAARQNLSEREQHLADHLARVDQDLRRLEEERRAVMHERAAVAESERRLRAREESVRDREETLRRRLDARLDEQLRDARREIDDVIEGLKARTARLANQRTVTTGDTGAARSEARAALDDAIARVKKGTPGTRDTSHASAVAPSTPVTEGARVTVGAMGLEGVVLEVHGKHAEVDVRGKRLRAALRDLRVIDPTPEKRVSVSIDLQPRAGSSAELNVIGCTVDEAIARAEKFLDESTVADQRVLRIVHGHGTGQLRRGIAAFLKQHPLVARFDPAPPEQGGNGATIVELKD